VRRPPPPPRPTFIFLVAAAIAAAACGGASDPVAGLVESLRTAAEDRDAQKVADRLADDFRGNAGVDRAEAAATLRRYFAAYESVHLAVYDVQVARRSEAEAAVGFRVEFTGSARRIGGLDGFLPPAATYHFDLRVVRRGADWRVASAEWKPIEPLASPGG
jgi:hypothetical protein